MRSKRPRPVDALAVGVHGERDAHGEDVDVGGVLAGPQLGQAERAQVLDERGGGRTGLAVLVEQLVPGAGERAQIGHRHVIVPSGGLCRLDVPFVTAV